MRFLPCLLLFAGAGGATACRASIAGHHDFAPRPGWRVLFNNDTTNILTCPSPFHQDGEDRFTDAMVRATVDEAAVQGVDAMTIMPGCGWIPWWPSKVYPMAEHEAWFQAHFGVKPHFIIDDYLLAGGDYLKVFIDECHRRGVAALVSYRLNDAHLLERSDQGAQPEDVETVSRFYVEHPELRLEPKATRYGVGLHNWLRPAARAYKLALITELLENYDLEGIELDFLRFPHFFPPDTPMPKRIGVMTEFIARVRSVLDRTVRNGQRRWLGVRVAENSTGWRDTGFDAAAYRTAGVDYFNLSSSYYTSQQTSLAEVRQSVPGATIFLEETHSPEGWPLIAAYDGSDFRRNTVEMLESTARLAYQRGADGISLFNFAYFRPYGPDRDKRGPFDAPPFDLLPVLANPVAVEKAPSYFYLVAGDQGVLLADQNSVDVPYRPGRSAAYSMDMVPLPGNPEGRLRLQIMIDAESRAGEGELVARTSRGRWRVSLNGHELAPASDPQGAYPFRTSIRAGFGHPEQYLSWRLPPGTAVDGINHIAVTYVSGPPELRLRWIEVFSFPAQD
jgi:hypothetical protein